MKAAPFVPAPRPTFYSGPAEGYRDHLLLRAMDAAATPAEERRWTRRAMAFDRVARVVASCREPQEN